MTAALHKLSLTVKIMLLVAMLGIISGAASLHTTQHIHALTGHYQTLLEQQAQAAHHIGVLRHHVGLMRHLVVRSIIDSAQSDQENDASAQLHRQNAILALQSRSEQDLQRLAPLLGAFSTELSAIYAQTRQSFAHSQGIAQALLRSNIARAQSIEQRDFSPTIEPVIEDIAVLQQKSQRFYHEQSLQLAQAIEHAIAQSNLIKALALALMTLLGGALALRYVSRPINRLTAAMQALALQRWDPPVDDQHRGDEIGEMARTLLSLGQSLKKSEALQQQFEAQRENHLLTEQLLELTSALPGTVFQSLLRPAQPLQLRFISRQWLHMLAMPAGHPDTLSAAIAALHTYCPQALQELKQHVEHAALHLQQVDFKTTFQRHDGSVHWCKVLATPRLHPDGSIVFNGVWLDISREAEQAQALEKAKQQAEHSVQARTLLQASVSHEIRTPLNAILGLAQVALKTPSPPPLHEQLESILRAGLHLRGIINEVLEFSKIDAGQVHLESTDFRLSNVLDDVVMMCADSASNKGLHLSYNVDSAVPDALRGDPHRIAQILLNYVNNAIKFTPAGSVRIHIRLAPDSGLHRVVLHASVVDTGLGIPADRLPQLFDPFQQADSSITRRFGGTGLGLAIVRELANLMGGETGADSHPNHGSTFWFTAVLEPARTPVARTASALDVAAAKAPAYLHGLRILVVDDNPLNRSVTQAMLASGGVLVDTAENGHAALDILLRHQPEHYAAVLMDLQMPVLDGLSATRQLRQYPHLRSLPVIAMTAHTSLSDVQKALEAGMNAHLGKPVLESSMWHALQQCIPKPNTASALPAPACAADTARALPAPPPLAPAQPSAPLPAVFELQAIDELAQLFAPDKLAPLVAQFVQDTRQRLAQLGHAMAHGDIPTLRADTHKISGTAATFGHMRLGHLSQQLTLALREGNTQRAAQLLSAMQTCGHEGIERMLEHLHQRAPEQDWCAQHDEKL